MCREVFEVFVCPLDLDPGVWGQDRLALAAVLASTGPASLSHLAPKASQRLSVSGELRDRAVIGG